MFHSCNTLHLKTCLMIKRILVLVPDQVKLIVAEDLSKRNRKGFRTRWNAIRPTRVRKSTREAQHWPQTKKWKGRGKCQICASTTSGQVTATIACSQSNAVVKLINSEASAYSTSIAKNASRRRRAQHVYIWTRNRQWHRAIVTNPSQPSVEPMGRQMGPRTTK